MPVTDDEIEAMMAHESLRQGRESDGSGAGCGCLLLFTMCLACTWFVVMTSCKPHRQTRIARNRHHV